MGTGCRGCLWWRGCAVPQRRPQPQQGWLQLSRQGSRGMKGDIIYWPRVNSSCESAFLMHLFCLVGICSSLCPKKNKIAAMQRGLERGTALGKDLRLETGFKCIAQ